jgi:hypothetical protein
MSPCGGTVNDLKKGRRFVTALMLTIVSPVAIAARADNTFRVSLTVLSTCNVQTRMLSETPLAGTIDMRCARSTPAAVYLNGVLVTTQQPYTFSEKVRSLSQGTESTENPLHMSADPIAHQSTTGNSQGEEVVDVVY